MASRTSDIITPYFHEDIFYANVIDVLLISLEAGTSVFSFCTIMHTEQVSYYILTGLKLSKLDCPDMICKSLLEYILNYLLTIESLDMM